MGSNPMAGEFIRREIRKPTPREEGQVKTEAEAGVMQPQAKDARSHQELEESRKAPPPTPAKREWTYRLMDFRLPASRTMRG